MSETTSTNLIANTPREKAALKRIELAKHAKEVAQRQYIDDLELTAPLEFCSALASFYGIPENSADQFTPAELVTMIAEMLSIRVFAVEKEDAVGFTCIGTVLSAVIATMLHGAGLIGSPIYILGTVLAAVSVLGLAWLIKMIRIPKTRFNNTLQRFQNTIRQLRTIKGPDYIPPAILALGKKEE